MVILQQTPQFADIRLSRHELLVLNNALNEICNGLGLHESEFETRLGVTKPEALNMLDNLNRTFG